MACGCFKLNPSSVSNTSFCWIWLFEFLPFEFLPFLNSWFLCADELKSNAYYEALKLIDRLFGSARIVVFFIQNLISISFNSEQDYGQWISYLSIILVIMFVVMFATGPGSIPWFLVTELFNSSARPMATSIAVTVNWVANFIVGLGFLPIQVTLFW